MEVVYEPKVNYKLPVISICSYYESLQENCGHSNKEDTNLKGNDFTLLYNKTVKELFEFEHNCSFLNSTHLIYIHNNTHHQANKIKPYLNFGLFCKMYEFENIKKNHNDGFFKIDSTHDHKLVAFMHENDNYPIDVNLKLYFSEFKNNQKAILILLELNKVIRSRDNLFFSEKHLEFNNNKTCNQNCFQKSFKFSKYNFLYENEAEDYFIEDPKNNIKNSNRIEQECFERCRFGDIFESYFKIEKITYNGDLIDNKTMTLNSWIIFYQNPRVVTFFFNSVITLTVYLAYVCNLVSLVFGYSFFTFTTCFVLRCNKIIKFEIIELNVKYSMLIISLLLACKHL